MTIHVREFLVNGLNIDTIPFNWKNRLLFSNSDRPNQHISTAYVKMSRSLTDKIYRKVDGIYQHDQDIAEARSIITLFLICYGLVSDKSLPKIDSNSFGSGIDIEEKQFAQVYQYSKIIPSNPSSGFGTMSIEETMMLMNQTVPLFDKVMMILEQKKDEHKIDVALIMYYRSLITFDFMEGFVDLITAFEALYSDSNADLTYKIALRASIFTETDPLKRRELFDYFRKEIYTARSALVHGKDISLGFTSKYHLHQSALRPIMKKSLIQYIELASKGITKMEILKHIDNIALGFKNN